MLYSEVVVAPGFEFAIVSENKINQGNAHRGIIDKISILVQCNNLSKEIFQV